MELTIVSLDAEMQYSCFQLVVTLVDPLTEIVSLLFVVE